jgi:hypothetical protein
MLNRLTTKVLVAAVLVTTASSTAACKSDSNNHQPSGGGQSSSGGAQSISGSLDDWEAAVCQTGSVFTGGRKVFRNAVAGNSCLAKNRAGPIMIGQWDDDYLMRNDIVIFRNGSYASARSGQTITDFVTPQPGGAALEPLTQFGFTINPIAAVGN